MLDDKAWLVVHVPGHPKVLDGVRSGFCVDQSSSSAPTSSTHIFMDLALCMRNCYVETVKGLPETIVTKLEVSYLDKTVAFYQEVRTIT